MQEITFYQWLTLAIIAGGFVGTWVFGAFKLGRAVEQMKSGVEKKIEAESLARLKAFEEMREDFSARQLSQDHSFGEVGAALRRHIETVSDKIREVEIWGRDHYVQKADLTSIVAQLREDFKEAVGEIKEDIRQLLGKH